MTSEMSLVRTLLEARGHTTKTNPAGVRCGDRCVLEVWGRGRKCLTVEHDGCFLKVSDKGRLEVFADTEVTKVVKYVDDTFYRIMSVWQMGV